MDKTKNLQEKVTGLYDRIRNDFYLCRNDLEVSGESYSSALLLGALTELNKGNQLVLGEYGGGKTTSAEYLHSVFNSLPLDLVKRVKIRGHPQLTEEKLKARPDFAKMHIGENKVTWLPFILVGPKIVDEMNRIPESNQAMILNGVDNGEWDYLDDSVFTGPQPLFATCNYSDRGNNDLIPPMLDRFDVAVESKFPGVANVASIAQDYHNEKDSVLTNQNLTRDALRILNSGKSYEEIQEELKGITSRFGDSLKGEGFSVLTEEDKEKIEKEIKSVQLNNDAEQYFMFLVSEMNVSPKYGQKRSIDRESNEHGLYLQSSFIGSGSRREEKSLVRYAKSLAWLQNQKKANLDHLLQLAPYVLWHRLKWNDETKSKFRSDDRDDPLDLHIAKQLLGDGTQEIPGVKKRLVETKANYQQVLGLIKDNKMDEARRYAETFAAAGKGHPIFLDTLKDLS